VSKRLDLASLKGDFAGGATSAVLTVPASMGYGVLALLPLGDQYISTGILAGLISKGTASVKVRLAGQDREKRLASFSAGAVFGEVALLDEEPRSATVTADEELVCYVLDDARVRALTGEHPSIAIKLLANLSRELSRRLRKANAIISQLEG